MKSLFESTSWYVKRSDHKLGPFTYYEIIRQLQDRALHIGDFVCMDDGSEWTKISDCTQFRPESIRTLLTTRSVELQNVFLKRQPRVPFSSEVIAHINKDSIDGESVELSANGAGLFLKSPKLYLGQNLFLFFKVSDEIPKFNAIGTIVNKRQVGPDTIYGIKFVNVNKDIREAIRIFTNTQAQKKAA